MSFGTQQRQALNAVQDVMRLTKYSIAHHPDSAKSLGGAAFTNILCLFLPLRRGKMPEIKPFFTESKPKVAVYSDVSIVVYQPVGLRVGQSSVSGFIVVCSETQICQVLHSQNAPAPLHQMRRKCINKRNEAN